MRVCCSVLQRVTVCCSVLQRPVTQEVVKAADEGARIPIYNNVQPHLVCGREIERERQRERKSKNIEVSRGS